MLLSGTFVVVVNGQTVLREKKKKKKRIKKERIGHASHSLCGSQNTRDSSVQGAMVLIVNRCCNGL